jgi:hypothetical protein
MKVAAYQAPLELAREAAVGGATLLTVPTNDPLPPERADVIADTRAADGMLAAANRIPVIRADVTGRADGLVSLGSTAITGSASGWGSGRTSTEYTTANTATLTATPSERIATIARPRACARNACGRWNIRASK